MAQIVLEKATDGHIKVRFHYAPELVEEIKKISRRSWHPEGKYWTIPATDEGYWFDTKPVRSFNARKK